MYFNKKADTNIDKEFNKKFSLSNIIKPFLNKYILIIIAISIIVVVIVSLSLNKKEEYFFTLKGAKEITIYQGTDYIEPGYDAYSTKDDNLLSEVVIDSDLNNNVVGKYEITYVFNDITETRIVHVVKKPQEYVFIYLNSVNDNVNIYLKKREKYTEPGYQAYSTTGIDLTNQVTISGEVNTEKKGTYKLTYSVLDSNGVTVSATRTVVVMDSEISLTLDSERYTNKDVIINAAVIDEYFDYMILPDGSKVSESVYSYKVSENGKYTFKSYSKKGNSKESSIEVKTIDRVAPTGNCSGSYKDGVSSITVSATDNIGISRYEINGQKYTTDKITIHNELNSVNVTIYDKAGNSKNISCSLENKNINPLDYIYTESNSHTNSINGIKYLLYNQIDSRWGNVKYSNGETIANNGCMITSVAVVSSAYDNKITPKTVFDTHRHDYPYTGINSLAGEGFSCKHISATNSKNNILNALQEGKIVVIMVYGKNKGGASSFTSSQHYMALIDYQDNKIFIGNAYSNSGKGRTGWYNQDSVLTSVREVNVCTPKQSLIDKFK